MRRLFAIVTLLGISSVLSALEITPQTCIVTSNSPDPVEITAEKVLRENLAKCFGKEVKTIAEKEWDGKASAIVLGRTEFAKKTIANYINLEAERWHIEAVAEKQSLIISGGWPRGTLFGVYDFLEYAGVRYFDLNEKYIPVLEKITVPDNFSLSKKPYFSRRFQYLGMFSKEQALFSSWQKLNVDAVPEDSNKELYTERQDGLCNTFYDYGKDFPADKPEYFSFSGGTRLRPVAFYGPGQFCYSHPDVRRLLKEKLKAKVKADKEYSLNNGCPPMRYYLLSINDCLTKCECEGCLALEKKYSAYSGAHLDFINDIASAVPDVTVVTRAYLYLVKPPKGIKPAANVKLSFAVLGVEFSAGMRDTMRPLKHGCNANGLKFLEEWNAVGGMFDIWDYQKLFGGDTPKVYTNIPAIISDSRTYAELKIEHFFSENEYGAWGGVCLPMPFHPLNVYVSAKMMEDPYRDSEALINDFMDKYYGDAGSHMKSYFDYLVKRQAEQEEPLGTTPAAQCVYLDLPFFKAVDSFLTQAESAVKSDPVRLRRVQQEWIPVDSQFLVLWNKLKTNAGMEYASLFDMEKVEKRLRENSEVALMKYFPDNYVATMREPQKAMIDGFLKSTVEETVLNLPEQFQGKNAVSVPAEKFQRVSSEQKLVDDPEAAGGKALVINKWYKFDGNRDPKTLFSAPPSFGIQNRSQKVTVALRTLKPSDIPTDEKFHFYRIGRSPIKGNVIAFAHSSWYVQIPTMTAFSAKDPDQVFDFWISVKLQGPAYVKDSEKPNAFIVDRLILVPAQKENIDASLPENLRGRGAVQVTASHFLRVSSEQKLTNDDDAYEGEAIRVEKWFNVKRDDSELFNSVHAVPVFGIQDRIKKQTVALRKLTKQEIPQDEKYHFFMIGKSKIQGNVIAFAHGSWYIQIPTKDLLDAKNPEQEYDFWISLKMEGPAYVSNSAKKNGFSADRLVLIPVREEQRLK